jgi:DNA-binding response OmpR family regulator
VLLAGLASAAVTETIAGSDKHPDYASGADGISVAFGIVDNCYSNLNAMLIAIFEDDISQRELVSQWLTVAGYDARCFEKGQALLQAMGVERYDLLVLDWNVPDISGIDVLNLVRERSHVPVLFCTARGAEEDIVRALRAGADDYLRKPLRRRELLARIEAVLRRIGMAKQA